MIQTSKVLSLSLSLSAIYKQPMRMRNIDVFVDYFYIVHLQEITVYIIYTLIIVGKTRTLIKINNLP